jgi:hypothetical protein
MANVTMTNKRKLIIVLTTAIKTSSIGYLLIEGIHSHYGQRMEREDEHAKSCPIKIK